MRRLSIIAAAAAISLCLGSCSRDDYDGGYPDTPTGNFDALWHIMDTRYCFFDLKQKELGVDWNQVYDKYRPSVSDKMSRVALFEVMASMLSELRDGHVNLYGTYDIARNWHWETDFPSNFNKEIRDRYLGDDYKIANSGYNYTVLNDNIGYLTIEDFSVNIGESRLDAVLDFLSICNGLIIDIRCNGGGNEQYASNIAARFTNERVLVGYTCYKTGPGHNDFSSLETRYIDPAIYHLRWQKPVALLVNRGCFSAANDFAAMMAEMPKVRLFGDRTGGGGGMPVSSELPCGWSVRFSSAPTFDARGNDIESGIEPHVVVNMTQSDMERGVDTIIETAREWINSMLVN